MGDQWKNTPPAAQVVGARRAVSISASSSEFDVTRAIHINTDGDYDLTFAGGGEVTLTLVGGFTYPFQVEKCTSAAAAIVGLY